MLLKKQNVVSWALVKNKELAEKMVKFVVLASIGVSKLSQIRAAKLINVIVNRCHSSGPGRNFFSFAKAALAKRWGMLRQAMELSKNFTLESHLYEPLYCNFSCQHSATFPGNCLPQTPKTKTFS